MLPAGVGEQRFAGNRYYKDGTEGSLLTLTVRGKREEIQTILQAYHPVFFEMIPLSLEEIFISETEVAGYDIKRLVFKYMRENTKQRLWSVALTALLCFFFCFRS